MSDKATQLVAEAAQGVVVRFVETFEWLAAKCESPIERLFLAGFLSAAETSGVRDQLQYTTASFTFGDGPRHPFEKADLLLQAQVGRYRVDFLIDDMIWRERRHFIAIECDGHDFHERTKEQARRDKARDRYFASLGIKVLRFTGSELYEDAERCADEVINHLTYQEFGPGGPNDRTPWTA